MSDSVESHRIARHAALTSRQLFSTDRLIVRQWRPDDATALLEVYGDREAMRWVGDGEPLTHEECDRWLEVTGRNYRLRGYGMNTLVDRASGEVVGFAGLVHPGGQLEAEIKYALARRHWGRGLATEAAIGLVRYGLDVAGLREIIATTAPENTASHSVLMKAGLQRAELRENEDGSATQVFRHRVPMPRLPEHTERLMAIVRGSESMMASLRAVRDLGLRDACIGAGALRNLIWDHLHGHAAPSALADVDVAHFDAGRLSSAHDDALQARLRQALPGVPWEVTNQAGVHQWFEAHFGHAVPPLRSLEEGVSSWPEYATAVGMRLEADDRLTVIAPHGLDDLFDMRVQRNPARVSLDTYRQRVAQKRYAERWPLVHVVPAFE